MINKKIKFSIIGFATLVFLLSGIFSCRYFSHSENNSNIVENINSNSNQTANNPANVNKSSLDNKTTKDLKLQSQSDSYLKLFDNMPSVPVFVRDEPILRTGSETQKGVAYADCLNKQPTIYVKKIFYDKANPKMLTNILKHELTHAYFCRQGHQQGHDELWRKKFREVGGIGN